MSIRKGVNPHVSRSMSMDDGEYYSEYESADRAPTVTCPNDHITYKHPAVGTYVCNACSPYYMLHRDGTWKQGRQ